MIYAAKTICCIWNLKELQFTVFENYFLVHKAAIEMNSKNRTTL